MMKSFCLSLLCIIPFIITAQTFVDSSAAGLNNGSSWNDAYTNLNMAIDSSSAGESIWVASGTYIPNRHPREITGSPILSNKDYTFHLKNEVKLYGGFDGTETLLNQRDIAANPTILSGGLDAINSIYCYHVLLSIKDSSNTIIDGFTIKDGGILLSLAPSILIEGELIYRANGAGMYNVLSNPSVNNLIFDENINLGLDGGAMYNDHSSPKIAHSLFINNEAAKGSGIYNSNRSNPTLLNVDFKLNNGYKGIGMYNDNSSPILISCVFEENKLGGNFTNASNKIIAGGGMYNTTGSAPSLNHVIFDGNSSRKGGGMYNDGSNPILINVVFFYNSGDEGGGMHNKNSSPTLSYVNFFKNQADSGGAIYNLNSSPLIDNCSIGSNWAAIAGGIYNDNSSPEIQSGEISYNRAGFGCGMYNRNSSNPIINDVSFIRNKFIKNIYDLSPQNGGGIYNEDSSPILTNVLFYNNEAINGGGVFNNNSSPSFTNVDFKNNEAYYKGGGMHNDSTSSPSLIDVTFLNNKTRHDEYSFKWDIEYQQKLNRGGGMHNDHSSSPLLTNVIFDNNESNYGGGMSIQNEASPVLENVSFINNAARQGGGIYVENSSPSISNVIFSNNQAQGFTSTKFMEGGILLLNLDYYRHKGGGMYAEGTDSITLFNVVFDNNVAEEDSFYYRNNLGTTYGYYLQGRGGGLYNKKPSGIESKITIINATFNQNKAETNTSLYDPEGHEIYNECPYPLYLHNSTIIEGINNFQGYKMYGTLNTTAVSGSNNLNINTFYYSAYHPEFSNIWLPMGKDLKWGTADDGLIPAFGSSLLDSGVNSFNTTTEDVSGQNRIVNTTIDIGAYEFTVCNDSTFYIGGNWTNGLPTPSKIAIFQDDYDMTDSGNTSILACACRIEAGSTLTVGDGTALHVYYHGINIIGTVIIEEGGSVINGIYN